MYSTTKELDTVFVAGRTLARLCSVVTDVNDGITVDAFK
jgi:hypothetical protein